MMKPRSSVSSESDEPENSEFESEEERQLFVTRIYGIVISESLFSIAMATGLNMSIYIREIIGLSSVKTLFFRIFFMVHLTMLLCCHRIRNYYPINRVIAVLLPISTGFMGGGFWNNERRYIIHYSIATDTILILLITLLIKYEKINFLRSGGIITVSYYLLSLWVLFLGIWQIYYTFRYLLIIFYVVSFILSLTVFGYLTNCIIGKSHRNLNWIMRMNSNKEGACIIISQFMFVIIYMTVLHCNAVMYVLWK